MQEPFRCIACGRSSGAATRCESCGATAFELARPTLAADAVEPAVAEIVSLQAAREQRGPDNSD